jgi:hypothetical protein
MRRTENLAMSMRRISENSIILSVFEFSESILACTGIKEKVEKITSRQVNWE